MENNQIAGELSPAALVVKGQCHAGPGEFDAGNLLKLHRNQTHTQMYIQVVSLVGSKLLPGRESLFGTSPWSWEVCWRWKRHEPAGAEAIKASHTRKDVHSLNYRSGVSCVGEWEVGVTPTKTRVTVL